MNEKLKQCPFCGSEAISEHYGYPLQYWIVICRECGGRMSSHSTRQEAITAWNKRVICSD